MMTMSVITVSCVWFCLRSLLHGDMRIPVLMSEPVLGIPSDGPFWRLIGLFFFVVILPYQVTSPQVTPAPRQASLPAVPARFLWPSSTTHILFPLHHTHARFVSLGLATVSLWEQELHRGPDHSQEVLVE